MEYNKRQMAPLIKKYQIDVEANTLFQRIIQMYEGQPNYQLWAVKVIFSKAATFDQLEIIHRWAANNKQLVKDLSKHNIVSYSSALSINQLMREINGLNKIAIIKNAISAFNTDQRRILTEGILSEDITPLKANTSSFISKWAELFANLNRIPSARKQKFLSNCSALHTLDRLEIALKACLQATYVWDKEDMLYFMHEKAPECEVIFNQGPYVILRIPDFKASKTLCGGGRTQWCITMQQEHWNSYSSSANGYMQYFYFDFSRKETDCFAHIGFTVEKGRGIITAQTCDNKSMLSAFTQGSEVQSIRTILDKCGVTMDSFLRLQKNTYYRWASNSLIEFVKQYPAEAAIAYADDTFVAINVMKSSIMQKIIGHTFIPYGMFNPNSANKIYLLFNFAVPYTKDDSIYAFCYSKDKYGSTSANKIINALGLEETDANSVFKHLGLKEDTFIGQEKLDSRILLHKYIDCDREDDAIELLHNEWDTIDINYEFNGTVPLFSAIMHQMSNLFKEIIRHPKFDSTLHDGYGETIFQTLEYAYGFDEVEMTPQEERKMEEMITIMLDCPSIDFNTLNINEDSALSIAAESPKMLWILKRLIARRDVNVNIVNDVNLTVLSNAIRNNNMEAVKLICMRPDLQITKYDRSVANDFKVDLNKFLYPSEAIFNNNQIDEHEMAVAIASR